MPFLATEHLAIPEKDILSWIFDDLAYDANKPIYIDAAKPEQCLTAAQCRKLIRQVIAGLRSAGLQPGDTVCIHSQNDIFYSALVLGIIGAGGVWTGTNPLYTPREMTHHLTTTRAKFLVIQPALWNSNQLVADSVGIPNSNVFMFNTEGQEIADGCQSWEMLLQHGEQDWVRFDDRKRSESTTAALFTTSGTTGLPKPAMISHYNLVAQHVLVYEHNMLPHQIAQEVRRIVPLPVFHAAVGPTSHTSALKQGHGIYMMRRFELEAFLATIERFQITDLVMVPPMTIATIMSPLRHKYSIKSLKWVCVGAAPLDKAPQQKFAALMDPGTPYTQALGMTETCCLSARFDGRTFDDTGSIGSFLPNLDIKLVDDDGNDVTAWNVTGELCIRGPIVVKGYFENPEATAQAWDSDGYYHSGDIAYGDGATGKWYIVDRKKELIKVKAYQVAPPEIEGILLDHPGIADAAIIGIVPPGHKGQGTELPRAYVVRKKNKAGEALTEGEVQEWVKPKLAKYKWLEGGVAFIDSVPRTASGKILKRFLREKASRETAAKL